MTRPLRAARRHSQRGAIAVEAAIVLPLLVIFALFPSIYWAMYFYRYSAAEKAAHDAALYMSTAPRLDMTTAGPDGSPAAVTVAKKIIAKEMAGLSPPDPVIFCYYRQASGAVAGRACSVSSSMDYKQTLVQLEVEFDMSYVDPLTGMDSGMRISPYVYLPYVGN